MQAQKIEKFAVTGRHWVAAVIFHNTWRDEVEKRGVHTIVPPVLFSGADMTISTEIRNKLLALEMPGASLHQRFM